jgi:hypothetical protein
MRPLGTRGDFMHENLGKIIILIVFLVIILAIIGIVLAPKFGGELPFP